VIAAVACLSVIYGAIRCYCPYDEVQIAITGTPTDTDFLCLVADKPSGAEAMLWSLKKVLPFTMHPDKCTVSFVYNEDRVIRRPVRWVSSDRVGVLRRTKDRKWFISWYDPPKSNLKGRWFLFGRGSWEVDLRDADEVQPVNEDTLRAMGMDYSLTH
jgi:hypothetical protein